MTATAAEQTQPETDKDRADKIVAGRTQPTTRKRTTSRASKAADKAASDSKQPKQSSKQQPKPAPKSDKPAAPKPPTQSDNQRAVMTLMIKLCADAVATDAAYARAAEIVPALKNVPRSDAAQFLADRLSYAPSASKIWDARLPVPARRK